MRRCVLVGVGVAFLEEVYHCQGGLCGLIYAQATPNVTVPFLLPADQNVELSAPCLAPCLPACHCASCHDEND